MKASTTAKSEEKLKKLHPAPRTYGVCLNWPALALSLLRVESGVLNTKGHPVGSPWQLLCWK